ncbi:MFS transporter [Nakamurella alba]|uniref:MFS transporter n=1 Tax=Nakamurella alba TaxID=2665158 RepID=UPI0018A90E56|nr:MFS transporter [Nakamurella alba]
MSPVRTLLPWTAFGGFWGVWGASLPSIRDQAGVDDAQLGIALLFVGLGALPAMAFIGRAVDRWEIRSTACCIGVFGLAAMLLAVIARGPVSLSIGLLVIGAASGAADVAINALSASAERRAGRPWISRSHGVFSASVVLGTGLVAVVSIAGGPVILPFVVVTALALVAMAMLLQAAHGRTPAANERKQRTDRDDSAPDGGAGDAGSADGSATDAGGSGGRLAKESTLPGALLLIGAVAALAFAVENAHQSWSAVFLNDVLHSTGGLVAAAPAVFAATAAVVRFAAAGATRRYPMALLLGGSAVAVCGSLLVAGAQSAGIALCGFAVAAAGTAVLYPTLISAGLRHVPDRRRGRATSRIATTAYVGFLLGPVYVGQVAGQLGLRAALVAVAILAGVLLVAAVPVLRIADHRIGRFPGEVRQR